MTREISEQFRPMPGATVLMTMRQVGRDKEKSFRILYRSLAEARGTGGRVAFEHMGSITWPVLLIREDKIKTCFSELSLSIGEASHMEHTPNTDQLPAL